MYAGDSGISVIRMQATINADKLSEVSSAECREPGEAASPHCAVSQCPWPGICITNRESCLHGSNVSREYCHTQDIWTRLSGLATTATSLVFE